MNATQFLMLSDKTALKRLGIKRGKDVAEMIMRRCATGKGRN